MADFARMLAAANPGTRTPAVIELPSGCIVPRHRPRAERAEQPGDAGLADRVLLACSHWQPCGGGEGPC